MRLTSQEKKAGVMSAFSSAPHLLYGNRRRNQGGTCGEADVTPRAQRAGVVDSGTAHTVSNSRAASHMHLREACHDRVTLLLRRLALHRQDKRNTAALRRRCALCSSTQQRADDSSRCSQQC